jgi:ketosteroid isomerase-like protein
MSEATIIDRMYAALVAGDVPAARACYAEDAIIWHGFDRIEMTRDEAAATWEAQATHFAERRVSAVRCQPTPTGFVQQLYWHVRTSEGKWMAWALCVVVEIRDGLIARLDEYIDRAGSFVPDDV